MSFCVLVWRNFMNNFFGNIKFDGFIHKFNFFVLFALLVSFMLLPSITHSCDTYFYDDLKVRALTNANIPIPNAEVNVTYQYSYSMPNRQVIHATDKNGIAKFGVRNNVGLSSRLDCNIYITVNYMNTQKSKTVVANLHGHPVDIFLDAYTLTIHPIDQTGKLLTNVTVLIDNISINDKTGRFYAIVTSGKHIVTLVYKGRKSSRTIDVTGDRVMSLQIGNYPLTLEVIDDYGRPVSNATVNVNGESCDVNSNGVCSLADLPTSTVAVTVTYKGKTYKNTYNILTSSFYKFNIDTIPPKITTMTYNMNGKYLSFNVIVTDNQSYASGIDNVKARYKIDNSVVGHSASVYVKSENTYAFEIENPGLNHKVNISVFAKDGAGNYASKNYIVTIYEGTSNNEKNSAKPGRSTEGANGSGNTTTSNSNNSKGTFNIFPVKIPSALLMVLGVIISIGGLYYLYNWKKGNDSN